MCEGAGLEVSGLWRASSPVETGDSSSSILMLSQRQVDPWAFVSGASGEDGGAGTHLPSSSDGETGARFVCESDGIGCCHFTAMGLSLQLKNDVCCVVM